MSRSLRIGSVRGIDVRLHFTFPLIVLWAAIDWGAGSYLGWQGALYGVVLVLLLFVCVVLHELVGRIDGVVGRDCTIQGNVVVEAGAVVERSNLRGPLIIGANTRVTNAYVGPFTAIGRDCEITESEIEHSIVMERTRILQVPHRIEDSLIGRDVVIFQADGKPRAYKLMLGDHSQAGIL